MTALIVIDVQNDFLSGGALPVKKGDRVISPINRLVRLPFDTIFASKDWHPPDHKSFALTHGRKVGEHIMLKGLDQILWPVHCVRNTSGAEFADELDTSKFEKVVYKGTDKDIDSYSAFFDNGHLKSTGLADELKERDITEVYIAGLVTDYCVKYSVLDAVEQGFRTHVVVDACRAVNVEEGDSEKALDEMRAAGAIVTTTEKVTQEVK
ncbi:MAG: bifunctional nicotinamidase/pyrazinamidase [Waddliaceae bacterium]